MPQVTMNDGQVLEFSEKGKVKKQSYIAENGDLVTKFAFVNGEYREHRTPRSSLQLFDAALHGYDQKFGDSFAGEQDVEDCIAAFEDMSARLANDGDWNKARESGGGFSGFSVLARALIEVTGKSKDEIKAALATLSAAEKAALRKTEPIASKILQIESAKAKKSGVDGSAILAGFLGGAAH